MEIGNGNLQTGASLGTTGSERVNAYFIRIRFWVIVLHVCYLFIPILQGSVVLCSLIVYKPNPFTVQCIPKHNL